MSGLILPGRSQGLASLLPYPSLVSSALTIHGASASHGWIALPERFLRFNQNILLTELQIDDGHTKRRGVVSCLNRTYYGTNSGVDHSFHIGSWAKDTAVRPPRDVDVYFVLPYDVYVRFQGYLGNRQSQLLQEVKSKLQTTFPLTDMSGDGQVVVVNFGSYSVEVVPAFALQAEGRYWICHTHNGGSYKETAPEEEVTRIEAGDAACARNLRPLIRMLKVWQAYCSVPIKSFHLELIATDFLAQSPWRTHSYFFYDWIVRDFFAYLDGKANSWLFVPGTLEAVPLGDAWRSRAQSAYARALKACDHEQYNRVAEAGEEWQKIFGPDIPRTV